MIRYLYVALLTVVPFLTAQAVTTSKSLALFYSPSANVGINEEFVGPFSSWLNVQTGCGGAGAVGNGSTDDTAAIQRCLNALGATTPVVYFPAPSVNYKITSTLTVFGHQNVRLVGADPASTTIKWAGASGGTMLSFSDNVNSHVIRLTFDGNNVANTAIAEDWVGSSFFDQGNLYTDLVLKNNLQIAFLCGATAGCADIPMVRIQYINNGVGAFVGNQNALDLANWYSYFSGNAIGISNVNPYAGPTGGGFYNAFNSTFLNSTTADLYIGNPLYASFRNNYSNGSNYFAFGGGTCGSNNIVLQNNTILDPVVRAYNLSDRGPLLMLDNKVRSAASPSVIYGSCNTGDAFSLGNTFTAGTVTSDCTGSSPVLVKGGTVGRCRSTDDAVVSNGTFNATFSTAIPLPISAPVNYERTIVEAAPSGSGTICSVGSPCSVQVAVCKAATGSTGVSGGICTGTVALSRNVVHLTAAGGNYTISATINVPASDIQIIGDSYQSNLVASGLAGAPIMKLAGPSQVTIRDVYFNGSSHTADGIEIDNADQAGAFVFGQLVYMNDYTGSGLYSDSLNNAVIEFHSSILTQNSTVSTNGGIRVAGGGANAGAQTNIFDMLGPGNLVTFALSGDGKMVVEDCWCAAEGETALVGVSGHHLATITGTGAFTFSGGYDWTQALATDATFKITDFTGTFTFADAIMAGEISATGSGSGANNFALGAVNFWRILTAATPVSTSPTLANFSSGTVPGSIAATQWIEDYCNLAAIPVVTTPTTVLSVGSTSLTMSTNATANTTSCGGTGRDSIAFYAGTPFSDASGGTSGYINPMTLYPIEADTFVGELPESGTTTAAFFRTGLSQLRAAKSRLPGPLVVGVTNVGLYNVAVAGAVNEIHVKP